MKTQHTLWTMLLATLCAALLTASEARAQTCASPADYPCDFEIGTIGTAKTPPIFKFQSRVSQAKLPVGEGTFTVVYAKVLNATGTELCREEFRNVTVRDSVLNLEIGHNMSCELEDVIAREQNLAFQICLGSAENCLKSVSLAAVPLSVKSTFSVQSEKAHQADFAGQAHYAHRLTADRNMLTSSSLGFGYFDFYTHVAADAAALYPGSYAADYNQYAQSGFIQWTPVQNVNADNLHIVGKDHATDRMGWLNNVVVFSHRSKVMGDLYVNERGDHDLGVIVTGDSRITGTCTSAAGGCSTEQLRPSLEVVGQVLLGYNPAALNGFADHRTHGVHGDLQIIGDTSNPEASLAVTGQVLLGYDLNVLAGKTDRVTHGLHGDLQIIGDPTNSRAALAVTGQILVGHSLTGLTGATDGVTHGIDGDVQIRGNLASLGAELEVTGRVLAGENPVSLDGFVDGVSSGLDSPLQVTGALTVNSGGVTVDAGGVTVASGGLHVFGAGTTSQIHGTTTHFGSVTIASNGSLSVPTGRVETFGGLYLSDNSTGFQPAVVGGGDVGMPLILVNPDQRFDQTSISGQVVFHDQVIFEVPPAIGAVAPAITAGRGVIIDTDPNDTASKRISLDPSQLDTLHTRIVLNTSAVSILNVARTTNVVEITTVTAHGLSGNSVIDVDASDNTFDASMVAGLTIVSDTRFRYTQNGPTVAQKPDTGRVVNKPEALATATTVAGQPPTLVINGRDQFGTTQIQGTAAVSSDLGVGGNLTSTGTITGACRVGTVRVGEWCVDRTASSATDVSDAIASCTERGMSLCSSDAMVHCKFHSATTACRDAMNAAAGLVLTSTILEDATATTLEERFAVYDNGTADNFSSARALGLPPSSASFFCCSAATPGF